MLIKRIGYYLVGVSIGAVAVSYIWKNKNATFDYGMDARTLKTIRIKKRFFSDEATKVIENSKIDTATISTILKNADVDFKKGKPRQKPCAEYFITGKNELKNISLYVSRCDSTATIEKITIE
ncbi:MAG: DUF4258 domain-containing protein [Flavobacteriia bacterium]|nr:DUF4258 domain-containing protein [Flavobacteriia bacterium]OIP45234.1 MAG: hypothetical protein AUK46_13040 [Flavobacteriaceae bacterium CG2_30_31_66]PIV97518.1 MAG: hypothetical protein COW43_02540 [Flavobacteriaceae bacterium CG17_big_fil_post_rev_8_21_14_2_50_31_13]PIX13038.1 MAG: hypothetical protein COZ74_08380 [Flavobacteriaceae bacterium CG_4_8_14_3_um_filter_31_8]PIY14280.1 MAG: hypothetical protein COZ16_09795 [Flavobacteriaceae bacterium CG_4_10_14_3_um_filter_31_253]PIZ10132.1 M